MRPTLIGEMPSPADGPDAWRRPLSGRVCTTLCGLARLEPVSYETLTEHFVCTNVLQKPRQCPSNWWGSLEARTRLEQIVALARGPCVLLGRSVARAANREWLDWGVWDAYRKLVVIPHPSGLNRLYNDLRMRDVASRALSEALTGGTR